MIEAGAVMPSVRLEASLEEIGQVAEYLVAHLPEHCILFLNGPLASGKTTLVNAIAKAKGCDQPVTSPTFSVQHLYGQDLFHYDIYQYGSEKFLASGLLEALDEPGWHMIEWADTRLKKSAAAPGWYCVQVTVTPRGDTRSYEIVDANNP